MSDETKEPFRFLVARLQPGFFLCRALVEWYAPFAYTTLEYTDHTSLNVRIVKAMRARQRKALAATPKAPRGGLFMVRGNHDVSVLTCTNEKTADAIRHFLSHDMGFELEPLGAPKEGELEKEEIPPPHVKDEFTVPEMALTLWSPVLEWIKPEWEGRVWRLRPGRRRVHDRLDSNVCMATEQTQAKYIVAYGLVADPSVPSHDYLVDKDTPTVHEWRRMQHDKRWANGAYVHPGEKEEEKEKDKTIGLPDAWQPWIDKWIDAVATDPSWKAGVGYTDVRWSWFRDATDASVLYALQNVSLFTLSALSRHHASNPRALETVASLRHGVVNHINLALAASCSPEDALHMFGLAENRSAFPVLHREAHDKEQTAEAHPSVQLVDKDLNQWDRIEADLKQKRLFWNPFWSLNPRAAAVLRFFLDSLPEALVGVDAPDAAENEKKKVTEKEKRNENRPDTVMTPVASIQTLSLDSPSTHEMNQAFWRMQVAWDAMETECAATTTSPSSIVLNQLQGLIQKNGGPSALSSYEMCLLMMWRMLEGMSDTEWFEWIRSLRVPDTITNFEVLLPAAEGKGNDTRPPVPQTMQTWIQHHTAPLEQKRHALHESLWRADVRKQFLVANKARLRQGFEASLRAQARRLPSLPDNPRLVFPIVAPPDTWNTLDNLLGGERIRSFVFRFPDT